MSDAEQGQAQAAETTAAEGSILESILEATEKSGEALDQTRAPLAEVLKFLLPKKGAKANKAVVDDMIAELDKKLSKQIDQVMHHEQFQKLESAWRGLKLVVERTDFRENCKIEIINCSKADLAEDFDAEMDITKTGLYKKVYSAEFGQFGGRPVGGIIANYDFGPGNTDIALLQKCAAVATMCHAPFITAADKGFFGTKDLTNISNMNDVKATLEAPQYTKWHAFRESEDARNVGLTLPRFLLRLPYGKDTAPLKSFDYNEEVSGDHEDYLWGNTAFAFATRLTDSFAKYRWCPNIIGPKSGGTMEDLPLHQFESMGEIVTKPPTETLLTERREYELAEEGFIPLCFRKGSDNACFFSANSCQKPKFFGTTPEGKQAETNYKLGTQLPYTYVISRLAHYIKVLQRENLGSYKERVDLERELNKWISQFVTEDDNPSKGVRERRPLRMAKIEVSDVEGEPGWYRVGMQVRPHFKYMGAHFTLSLVGKLDK